MYALAVLASVLATASALTIDSPASLIVCQPVSLTFSGGASTPYYLAAIPGGEPSAAALVNIATTTSSPYAWTVNLASGTNVSLKVTDGSGNIAYTSSIIIQAGSSTSCLTSSSSSSASSASSGATAAAAGSSSAGSSSAASASAASASSKSASSSASGTASTSASAASASTSKSAADRNAVYGGALAVAGLIAAVVAA